MLIHLQHHKILKSLSLHHMQEHNQIYQSCLKLEIDLITIVLEAHPLLLQIDLDSNLNRLCDIQFNLSKT